MKSPKVRDRKWFVLTILQNTLGTLLAAIILSLSSKFWPAYLVLLKSIQSQQILPYMLILLLSLIFLAAIYILHLYKVINSENKKWENPSVMHDDELIKRLRGPSKEKNKT